MTAAIHAAGAAVPVAHYRGLGRSDRSPLTEATMDEDAEAAWLERLIPRSPERALADLTRRAAPSRAG